MRQIAVEGNAFSRGGEDSRGWRGQPGDGVVSSAGVVTQETRRGRLAADEYRCPGGGETGPAHRIADRGRPPVISCFARSGGGIATSGR